MSTNPYNKTKRPAAASRPAAVHNPYAKKQKTLDPLAPFGNAAAAAAENDNLPKLRPTSFSQAFGDDNDNLEYSTAASTAASATTTTTNNNNNSSNDFQIRDARDFHTSLQPHVLGVSPRQQGNGLLKYIRNVPTQLCQMVPDYIMNGTSCALFLSLKYHQLYPQYIYKRLGELGNAFKVRVLLVFVDVDDCANSLLQLNKLGVTNELTVILAWSEQEAARYLETFKALDGKDATSIQKRASNNVVDQMTDVLTTCKPMNKTDAATVWEHFGNLRGIAQASQDELAL
ncbi:MAG: hypothetical protein SGARI_004782, partial [Bacillariaceae sp.]